ncbi:MAG: hypothetical protein ACREEM_46160 [Blastocatellia bacterium]
MIIIEMLVLVLEGIARFCELPSRLLQRIADEFKKAQPGQDGLVAAAVVGWLAIFAPIIGFSVWMFSGKSGESVSVPQPEKKVLIEPSVLTVPTPAVITPSPVVPELTEADMVLEVADIKEEIAETEKELKDARKNAPDDVPDLQADLADARTRLAEAQKGLREMRKRRSATDAKQQPQ